VELKDLLNLDIGSMGTILNWNVGYQHNEIIQRERAPYYFMQLL
jgi:hypothetical protein